MINDNNSQRTGVTEGDSSMASTVSTPSLCAFEFEGHVVRTFGNWERPLWVLNDVGEALGIMSPRSHVLDFDEVDVDTINVEDSAGRRQLTKVLTESGLYRLIFLSRKDEARRFQRWVTREVLPALRKTGRYELARPKASLLGGKAVDVCYATAAEYLRVHALPYSAPSFGMMVSQICKGLGYPVAKLPHAATALYPIPALRMVAEARGILKPAELTEGRS